MCASRTRPEARKAPKIASNSFHLRQRIGTYQRFVSDSRAKFFSRPLLPAGHSVLRADRSVANGCGGRIGYDGTGQLGGLLQDGGQRTKIVRHRELGKPFLYRGREAPRFSPQEQRESALRGRAARRGQGSPKATREAGSAVS